MKSKLCIKTYDVSNKTEWKTYHFKILLADKKSYYIHFILRKKFFHNSGQYYIISFLLQKHVLTGTIEEITFHGCV